MVLDNITNVVSNVPRSDDIVKAQDRSNVTLRGLQRAARTSAPAVGGSAAALTPRSATPHESQARGRSADGRSAPPSREGSPARGSPRGAARPAPASCRALSSRLGVATASSAARGASRGRERSAGPDGPGASAPLRRTPSASRERSARAASPKARSEDSSAAAPDGDRATWANALWDQRERHEALCAALAEKRERLVAKRERAKAANARRERCVAERDSVGAAYGPTALEAQDKRQAEVGAELETARAAVATEEAKKRQLQAGLAARTSDLERHRARLEELREAKTEKVAEVEAKVRLSADLAEAAAEKREVLAQKAELLTHGVAVARRLHNGYLSLKGNIRVFCRLRPRLPAETDEEVNISIREESKLTVRSNPQKNVTGMSERSSTWDFDFDHVFNTGASQEAVFEEIQLLVQSALDGYKVAIFAYGQTGSGKTHTMAGDAGDAGVIPRAVDLIFAELQELRARGWHFEVHATLLEVYNEAVCDVLAPKAPVETAPGCAPQYSAKRVEDAAGVHALLRRAAQKRHVAATACNDRSSRSHAVFQLAIEGRCEVGGRRKEVQGLLSLVDLAGSERVEKSGAVGERLKEAQHINKSLSALGDVIEALGRKGQGLKESHIPYRNSRLTTLLKDSLGGDSKTLMFVNISPCLRHLTETLSSLRFASKVHACNVGVAKRHAADGSAGAAASFSSAASRSASAARRRSRSCPASPERRGRPAEGLSESSCSWADIF